jgi:hypothetical protein
LCPTTVECEKPTEDGRDRLFFAASTTLGECPTLGECRTLGECPTPGECRTLGELPTLGECPTLGELRKSIMEFCFMLVEGSHNE